jgi:hypothetical protein
MASGNSAVDLIDGRHRTPAQARYSGSRVAVHRSRAIKWRFLQENATFHRTEKST